VPKSWQALHGIWIRTASTGFSARGVVGLGYQWEQPGDMIHVDINHCPGSSVLATGSPVIRERAPDQSLATEKLHVAIDDATRLSYAEALAAEWGGATTVGFLSRAVAWSSGQGIECRRVLGDKGCVYKSHSWREACQDMGWIVMQTRPYASSNNGKAECFSNKLR
jgi:hypothetical protein